MGALAGLVDKGLMAADWAEALAPVDEQIAGMGRFLREEVAAGRGYQPAGDLVFRAFRRPLADVRVLVVGQDPYPNPRHPIGLSFAVERHVRPLPPSLVNIYRELRDDLGIEPPDHGDLSAWADRGVMLLNRVLTVRPGDSNSHPARAGRRSPSAPSPRSPDEAARARRSSGALRRRRPLRCWAGSPGWGRRTRRRCPPTAASSGPGPSARSTPCWRPRAPTRSTGGCRPPDCGSPSLAPSLILN